MKKKHEDNDKNEKLQNLMNNLKSIRDKAKEEEKANWIIWLNISTSGVVIAKLRKYSILLQISQKRKFIYTN